jgi:hypothetical protein
MTKTTITEALADVKTSLSRVEKKRNQILQYLGRDARLRDPFESEGGVKEFVRRELQAISDLEMKIVRIRSAIQKANLSTTLEIEGTVATLAEWLNWRREVSAGQQRFIQSMANQIGQLRNQATRAGASLKETEDKAVGGDIIVSVSETQLAETADKLERTLGTLDGKLSLLNATTLIEY